MTISFVENVNKITIFVEKDSKYFYIYKVILGDLECQNAPTVWVKISGFRYIFLRFSTFLHLLSISRPPFIFCMKVIPCYSEMYIL